ncbi:MAG: hypothetical protein UU78_C0025G0009, partial [Candidatus Roizmanbacteria bacterium GW2011_GWC2_41_7]
QNLGNLIKEKAGTIMCVTEKLDGSSATFYKKDGILCVCSRNLELLETEGFEQFDTGNADSFDFTDTEARMKEEVPASVFTSIMESLEDYTVVEGDVLDEDADYDIVITVGQKK